MRKRRAVISGKGEQEKEKVYVSRLKPPTPYSRISKRTSRDVIGRDI